MPQILRGPSAVFGDDDDDVDGDGDRGNAGVRAWSSQYYPKRSRGCGREGADAGRSGRRAAASTRAEPEIASRNRYPTTLTPSTLISNPIAIAFGDVRVQGRVCLLPSGSSRCISRTACGSLILHDEDDNMWQQRLEEPKFDTLSVVNEYLDVVPCRPHPVYVDMSRRRYLVSSDLIGHPLFSVLVEHSGGGEGMSSAVINGYEVVLLEHLLRMLRNDDVHPELTPDNFVDFFTLDLAAASTLS
uniref:Uncharacterized protein n=1 Tax=Ananas comosus var. bracteatus TaxID=296719 RepID=A0A6V7PHC9_ANACO|nr:unnamed protein product [Ananas comosus var. bracteatus]